MHIIKEEFLATHPFASLTMKHIKTNSGKNIKHLLLMKKDAVCLTLFDTYTQSILFVNQFRAGAHFNIELGESNTIEPVAGHIDPGESPIEAAIREAKEETDIVIDASQIEFIAKGLTSPGISNEMHHHYYASFDSSKIDMAKILSSVHGIDDEEIKVVLINIEDAMNMVKNGEIFSSHAIIGVMHAFFKHKELPF
jgi:ADP-ribose pyrophosphatase